MNDPAFQSQELADRASARSEQHIRDQGAIVGQGLQNLAGTIITRQQQAQQLQMQQQQMRLEELKAGSAIASQEVQRQTAMQELAWARELHSTDMLKLQKKALAAQTSLVVAKAQKEQDELGGFLPENYTLNEEQRDAMIGAGVAMSFEGRRLRRRAATAEEQSAARTRMQARQMATAIGRNLDAFRDQYGGGTQRMMQLQDVQAGLLDGSLTPAQARAQLGTMAHQAPQQIGIGGSQPGDVDLDAGGTPQGGQGQSGSAASRLPAPPDVPVGGYNDDDAVGGFIDTKMAQAQDPVAYGPGGQIIPPPKHAITWANMTPEIRSKVRTFFIDSTRLRVQSLQQQPEAQRVFLNAMWEGILQTPEMHTLLYGDRR